MSNDLAAPTSPPDSESRALEALLWLYDNGAGEFFASVAMRAQGVTNVNAIPAAQGLTDHSHRTVTPLKTVNWYCPHCGNRQIFTMRVVVFSDDRETCNAKADCLECKHTIHFWAMLRGHQVEHLAMHPAARRERVPLRDVRLFPERIRDVYEQAFHGFMSGYWDTCIAMCRKLVEGALKEATGTEGVPMTTGDRIDAFTGAGGWADKLKHKLQVLYGAGNLGAHFDEIAPTYPMATKVMDIAENILSLVYAWPATVDELDELLKNARETQAGLETEGDDT